MYLTEKPISLEALWFVPSAACGATASFTGIVRNHDHGRPVKKLFYESYPVMANKVIDHLISEAKRRWPVDDVAVLHRVGELEVGETAVAIAVSAAHRDEAFEACRFMIESIKHEAPIWKKQIYEDGSGEWVFCHAAEARAI